MPTAAQAIGLAGVDHDRLGDGRMVAPIIRPQPFSGGIFDEEPKSVKSWENHWLCSGVVDEQSNLNHPAKVTVPLVLRCGDELEPVHRHRLRLDQVGVADLIGALQTDYEKQAE
jgi:hypothetical protein